MPLSEEEQRILQEIERSFYENDPELAEKVGSGPRTRGHPGRNAKWAALAFLVGLVMLITLFASSLILGFLGFVIMLGSAMVFQHDIRRLGGSGWQQWSQSVRNRGIGDRLGKLGGTRERLRKRLKRED